MNQSRLNAILRRELESSQLQLSSYGAQQLESLIGHGLTRMKATKVLDHPGYGLQAERNLRALVDYFSKYAKKMDTFPHLGDNHFEAALRTAPTLWPFSTSG